MNKPKKPGTTKARTRRLKLKRQTVRDLGARLKGSDVNGGIRVGTVDTVGGNTCITCTCLSCLVCPVLR
jgi:hypothetical protein